jgi:ParB family chromosome partitioning protein
MEQDIRIDQIHFDRAALRQSVTEESVKTLADSIRTHGLLQAIVVSPRQGGGYRLIAGRRRLMACISLQYITIPARIIETEYTDELPALAENLMRLQMNPLEEAEAIRFLHEQKGLSLKEICELTNHGSSWVQDRLFLCTLPDNFKKAVADKKITIGAAGQLMQIHDTDYRDYLLSVAIVNGATVNQCQAWLLDYQARSRIMNPTGTQPIEPRLPMEPPTPQTCCAFCNQRVAVHLTVLLRFCQECNATLEHVKKHMPQEPPTNTSQQDEPTPSPTTPNETPKAPTERQNWQPA